MDGIEIGQIWREVDPRFERKVRVVNIVSTRSIKIINVETGRITTAHSKRFNGKRGGYALAPPHTQD